MPSAMSLTALLLAVPLLAVIAEATAGEAPGEPYQAACDVCVVGGGSAGYGAALAAARAGAKVILVERQPRVGGTSTSGFVVNWQAGPGDALAEELYRRLAAVEGAVAVAAPAHSYQAKEPYGIAYGVPGSKLTYADTLPRAGVPRDRLCCVVMRPEGLAEAMLATLREAGVTMLLETALERAEAGEGKVRSVQIVGAGGRRGRIAARAFIDATGGAHLCRAVGCQTMLGAEGRDRFGEPSAPDRPGEFLNAISLCYRIRKAARPKRQPAPARPAPFPRAAYLSGVGQAEFIVNPCRWWKVRCW